MNKGQINQQQNQQQTLHLQGSSPQIKQSLTNNFLNQRKYGSAARDFNHDMIQLMQQNQPKPLQNISQVGIPKIEISNVNKGVLESPQNSSSDKLPDQQNILDRNLYLKAQQKLFTQNHKIPPKVISFEKAKEFHTDRIKQMQISFPQNKNEHMNDLQELQPKKEQISDQALNFSESPFNKTKNSSTYSRKTNQNYFSQPQSNSKFSSINNSQFSSERKDTGSSAHQTNILTKEKEDVEKHEESGQKRIDPLSRVRLLKQQNTSLTVPQSFNLSLSSMIEKNQQSINKKLISKDLKIDGSNPIETVGALASALQNQLNLIQPSLTSLNNTSNTQSSQRNLLTVGNADCAKPGRSQSQKQSTQFNKRRFSATINQQALTPQQNPEEKKSFSSFLKDYFQSSKEVSPKFNTLVSPSEKSIQFNQANLIKKVQAMSQYPRPSIEQQMFAAQQIQLNFPAGPFLPSQTIHSTKQGDKNQPGQISIQALIPSSLTKTMHSPNSINSNLNFTKINQLNQNFGQLFQIEELESIKQKARLFPLNKLQLNQHQQPTSMQELQIQKDDDTTTLEQTSGFTYPIKPKFQLQSPKSFTETLNSLKLTNQVRVAKINHNHIMLNPLQNLQNDEYQTIAIANNRGSLNSVREVDSLQYSQKYSKDDSLFSKEKQKLKSQQFMENKSLGPITLTKVDVLNFEKEQAFYSLSTRRTTLPSSTLQNTASSSTLTTSRYSYVSPTYNSKKKFPSFQSQRDLPSQDTSSINHIDIAPFTNQTKENTHLQNLIQKVDEQPQTTAQQTQNTQSKYRYLKSNISLEQSYDNEDEDFYNYTQNIKVQNQNTLQLQSVNLNQY